VYQGGRRLGALDRRLKQTSLDVTFDDGQPLDILVENLGRTNFGPQLVNDRKGILGRVTLDSEELTDWETYCLPLTDPGSWPFTASPVQGPALHRGTFTLAAVGDTFLDLRGWGIGAVWVNGHCLGRYWSVGPQQSLFLPAPWLKRGANEVIVLDLEEGGRRTIQAAIDPVYETPGR